MIQIVFENEHFFVCDKPALVLSVPDRMGKESERNCLGIELQKKHKAPVYPVHRLDFEVSGLILFAKNSKSHQISQDWFQKRTLKKYYQAQTGLQNFDFLKSWPETAKKNMDQQKIEIKPGQSLTWNSKLVRGKKRTFEAEHGEPSTTKAMIKEVTDQVIHWQLEPITGKPHQLRYELCKHGFPILGDVLYGGQSIAKNGIALRAVKLDLTGVGSSSLDRLGLPEVIQVLPFEI